MSHPIEKQKYFLYVNDTLIYGPSPLDGCQLALREEIKDIMCDEETTDLSVSLVREEERYHPLFSDKDKKDIGKKIKKKVEELGLTNDILSNNTGLTVQTFPSLFDGFYSPESMCRTIRAVYHIELDLDDAKKDSILKHICQ